MRLITVPLFALALALPAAAQDAARITVTGEGRVEAPPDLATFSLGVTTQAATAAEAMAANALQLATVLEQLRAAGIEERDLQTSGLALNPDWRQPEGEADARIVGYIAINTLTVRVRALDTLGGLLDRAISNGANTFNGLSFGLADSSSALDEARKRAVQDAMARARLLTSAAGVTLGPVVSITETAGMMPPMPMYRMEADAASAPVPVAVGEISTAASVTMVFAIE